MYPWISVIMGSSEGLLKTCPALSIAINPVNNHVFKGALDVQIIFGCKLEQIILV